MGDLPTRALNATILPPLRRIASAIIPPFGPRTASDHLGGQGGFNCFFTILKVGCVLFDDGPYFWGFKRIFSPINAASY